MAYTYMFVTAPALIGVQRQQPPYQDVINKYASEGWRFVQLVVDNPAAIPAEYVLIFERPAVEANP